MGTGGTLAGVSMALKARNPNVKSALADPHGAALFNFYKHGELKAEGSSITEGIGQGRVTANLEGFKPDEAFQIPDGEAIPFCFELLRDEGLCLGTSSGINVAGAYRLARAMGRGHIIVTLLVRLRHALCVETLQPRIPALERPAGARMAGEQKMSALVSTQWLADHLSAPDIRVVDASWYLPDAKRDAKAEYVEAHIPGAVFFDIDEIADTASPYPHMLPAPEKFASRVKKLGLGDGHRIVVYDGAGLFSAARVWWMFRVMGHEDVFGARRRLSEMARRRQAQPTT